jgi:hypothetical protein
MVDRGNVDKHRMTYSRGVKAVEEQKWGRATAEERYGSLKYREDGAPPPEDRHAPQKLGDRNNMQAPGYANIVDSNSWVRGGGAKRAEGKPNFDHRGNPNDTRRSSFERRVGFDKK